jgi:hypothetical protein
LAKIYTTPVTITGGVLSFTGVPGSAYNGTVTITAAFAESPVPEPATFVFAIMGVCGVLVFDRNRSHKRS